MNHALTYASGFGLGIAATHFGNVASAGVVFVLFGVLGVGLWWVADNDE
jgi:hypothetical protein